MATTTARARPVEVPTSWWGIEFYSRFETEGHQIFVDALTLFAGQVRLATRLRPRMPSWRPSTRV
jgi:hypothetical protein